MPFESPMHLALTSSVLTDGLCTTVGALICDAKAETKKVPLPWFPETAVVEPIPTVVPSMSLELSTI